MSKAVKRLEHYAGILNRQNQTVLSVEMMSIAGAMNAELTALRTHVKELEAEKTGYSTCGHIVDKSIAILICPVCERLRLERLDDRVKELEVLLASSRFYVDYAARVNVVGAERQVMRIDDTLPRKDQGDT